MAADLGPFMDGDVSAGMASVLPLIEHHTEISGKAPVNLAQHFTGQLGGAFSFTCMAKCHGLCAWARVFDFSLAPDQDSITVGAVENTSDLHFTVFQGERPVGVRVPKFFVLGQEFTLLCTVSESGHIKVFKDGALVGENPEGAAPLVMERPYLMVGGHFHFANQGFDGTLRGVKVWDSDVSWAPPGDEAAAAAATAAAAMPEVPASEGEKDAEC